VIGIGPGHPEQITVQAIRAMNQVDAFFVLDKGQDVAELARIRRELCERYATERPYRVVEVPEVARDRSSPDYRLAVGAWHRKRAEVYADLLVRELGTDESGAFLVWGDPSLYDSTLRVLDRVLASGQVEFTYEVVPGITSVQALAAAHRTILNGVGEGALITTGRRLEQDWQMGADNVLVMLDGSCTFACIDPDDVDIFWGAYLGTPDEITLSGPLAEVGELIQQTRAAARARKGWIMDTYLLRRRAGRRERD
jgi:precorrin-6A synthase